MNSGKITPSDSLQKRSSKPTSAAYSSSSSSFLIVLNHLTESAQPLCQRKWRVMALFTREVLSSNAICQRRGNGEWAVRHQGVSLDEGREGIRKSGQREARKVAGQFGAAEGKRPLLVTITPFTSPIVFNTTAATHQWSRQLPGVMVSFAFIQRMYRHKEPLVTVWTFFTPIHWLWVGGISSSADRSLG